MKINVSIKNGFPRKKIIDSYRPTNDTIPQQKDRLFNT
jgi:hypothetical protein